MECVAACVIFLATLSVLRSCCSYFVLLNHVEHKAHRYVFQNAHKTRTATKSNKLEVLLLLLQMSKTNNLIKVLIDTECKQIY